MVFLTHNFLFKNWCCIDVNVYSYLEFCMWNWKLWSLNPNSSKFHLHHYSEQRQEQQWRIARLHSVHVRFYIQHTHLHHTALQKEQCWLGIRLCYVINTVMQSIWSLHECHWFEVVSSIWLIKFLIITVIAFFSLICSSFIYLISPQYDISINLPTFYSIISQ